MNVFEFDEAIDEMVEENMTKEEIEQKEKEKAFAAEQRAKYKTHTFTSATELYLVLGIIAGVFVGVFESIALFAVTAGWCLLLQIPVLFCLFVVTFIVDWVKRRNFTIYLAKKEPDLSLEFIKKHYIVSLTIMQICVIITCNLSFCVQKHIIDLRGTSFEERARKAVRS